MAGQLFNSFLALSLRTIPLIGLGVVAFSLFWTKDLVAQVGAAPAGMKVLADPAYAWGELIKATRLPPGFIGVLVASELAAFMSAAELAHQLGLEPRRSTISTARSGPSDPPRRQIIASRLATLCLFLFAAFVSIFWVKGMVSWFLFINSVMVIFLLPLSWLRFFWWRFNVWGELAAFVLGLPLSILVWFVLGYENKPFWQGTGFLFAPQLRRRSSPCRLLTPPESQKRSSGSTRVPAAGTLERHPGGGRAGAGRRAVHRASRPRFRPRASPPAWGSSWPRTPSSPARGRGLRWAARPSSASAYLLLRRVLIKSR